MSRYWRNAWCFGGGTSPNNKNAGNNSKDQIVEALLVGPRQDSRALRRRGRQYSGKFLAPHGTGNMLKCYGLRSISSITPV